ncbi:MAG: STAS domain-containing protein [Acidobacteriaceae bacterium]|nr:STAS domain-containing protein [Acidobacteriaceae bacterium]
MRKSLSAVSIDRIGDLAVVEVEGVITRIEAACKLRDVVTSLEGTQLIVLDLSEVAVIDDNGLTTFLFLQHWAHQHRIQLKLFNPRCWVREQLEHASPIPGFDFASPDEIVAILANARWRATLAA